MHGVRLTMLHPELPSCSDCQRWLHDDNWAPVKRGGKPVDRPKGSPLPCWKCPKIPSGKEACPANAQELSPKNWTAYLHYRRCKAVGRFPFDRIVERNAGLILLAEEAANRQVIVEAMLPVARR